MNNVYIIAEAGVNHCGKIELAKKLIDAAKSAGADAVKFQAFKAKHLVAKHAAKAEYQIATTGNQESQYEMIKRLELGEQEHYELLEYCKQVGIDFLSSPFDIESMDFLVDKLGLTTIKVPSGEITNYPYLKHLAKKRVKIIISTGMCELEEIEEAITVLKEEDAVLNNLIVLHCNTEYPTPFEDVNLNAMLTIKNKLNVTIGYSDHTNGIEVPIAAVALGAVCIEKHFTLDRTMEGPDHLASLLPDELKAMVDSIRNVSKSLGGDTKKPSPSELKNIKIARKSLVAKRAIKKGEVFSEQNLTCKRPGSGISPMKWREYIGQAAQKDYDEDDLI